jgi:2-methylcitrate dehydratase PrpD
MRDGGAITIAAQLAQFAVNAYGAGLDDGRRHAAACRLLDLSGNCLLALPEAAPQAVARVVRGWGGSGPASVFGQGARLPAASAALLNGTLAHTQDFDDTHLPSVLHPSASVLPAALAVAQHAGAGGCQLLDAASIGTEVCIRLGMAGYHEQLGNSIFFERGQHATSICGTVGAAAAAALLLGLDAAGLAAAMGIAASMGAGLLEANRTGGTVKRIHCGWAAHAGVAAAQLAQAGISAPPTVFEGRFGFFQAWCGDQADPGQAVAGLGQRWLIDDIIVKPYPCNHFTHPGIDAALALRAEGLDWRDVAALELGVPTAVLRTIAEPAEVKARPPSGYAAAFSGPYTVAAALIGGGGLGLWFDDFSDAAAADPQRLALAARVRCVADARCDQLFPRAFPAVLRATLRDGRRLERRVDASKGGLAAPITLPERRRKFLLSAARAMDVATAGRMCQAIFDLCDGGGVDAVFAHAGREAGQGGQA